MTVETCELRLRVATDKGDEVEMKFWGDRIAKRKGTPIKTEVKKSGKRSA